MPQHIFITGIGTGVGKTLVSAIVTEALHYDYWKPIQAGYETGTDAGWVKDVISNPVSRIIPELYKLKMPASPHIAAREECINIDINKIQDTLAGINKPVVIEGAGGLMVPLSDNLFVADLIKKTKAKVILVSRNYLGSINHSLLTAAICRHYELDVMGWIFNDQYLSYEQEIANWSGYDRIASIPFSAMTGKDFVTEQASLIRHRLNQFL